MNIEQIKKKKKFYRKPIWQFVCLILICLSIDLLFVINYNYLLNTRKVAGKGDTYTVSGYLDEKPYRVWGSKHNHDCVCFRIEGKRYDLTWYGSDESMEAFISALSHTKDPITVTVLKTQPNICRMTGINKIIAASGTEQSVDMTEKYNRDQRSERKLIKIGLPILFFIGLITEGFFGLMFYRIYDVKRNVSKIKEWREKEKALRRKSKE